MKILDLSHQKLAALGHEQALLVFQSTLAATAITPFGVWRLSRGEWGQGFFDLTLVLLLLSLTYLAIKGKRLRLIQLTVASLYVLSSFVVTYHFGALGYYWFFPAIVAIFFVVRAHEAITLAGIGLIAHVLLRSKQFWGVELVTFIAASSLVTIFVGVFALRLRNENHQLFSDSNFDSLTGAGNRRQLDDVLTEVTKTDGKAKMSMLMLDIDHFKLVNDQYGHAIGDLCLSRLAHLLMTDLKPIQQLFRYGGEEFIVLTNGNEAEAMKLAEQLRSDVENTQLIREKKITVSVGVATRTSNECMDAWLKRVDKAMYEAKKCGRNQCRLAAEATNEKAPA